MIEQKRLAVIIIAALIFFGLDFSKSHEECFEKKSDPVQVQEKPIPEPPQKITGADGGQMVLIIAGEFQMGSNDGVRSEKPVHTVHLDAFYIDKYEVTNAQYRRFVRATGHKEPEGNVYEAGKRRRSFKPWADKHFNRDNQPVVCVNWGDAKNYCKWAGKRLPTEAEWEKAARGGLVDKRYPWGDKRPDGMRCNFADASNNLEENISDGYKYVAPVGSFAPNGYGLYEMAGNVSEWCADWFDPGYYTFSPRRNPTGSDSGQERILRGGSWLFDYYSLGVARRGVANPLSASTFTGFRCVQDVVTP